MNHYRTLKWIVEYRDDVHPYWEPIAAFNSDRVALMYAARCREANPPALKQYDRKWRTVEKRGKTFVEITEPSQ